MRNNKIKNPLRKRLLREFKSDFGKYIVIFALMIITIGLCSGFQIADSSMMKAYDEGVYKYNLEHGNFKSANKLNKSQKSDLEELGVRLCDLYSITMNFSNNTHIRIYENRADMNLVCLMEGKMPKKDYEIALDRMHADNNKYKLGEKIKAEDGSEYTITGFIALPDYSCLYEDNSDTMFEATQFGVGIVTAEMFSTYDRDLLSYTYAWQYENEPSDKTEAKKMGDELLEKMNKQITLEEYTPAYMNQAITFAREDMGKDGIMIQVLCYMLIVLLAFVFAITIKNTIVTEANVIGTLRASGFSRGELLVHYISVPTMVSLVSSLVGNILGYTAFKEFCASMYYGSYSLPTYVTIWNADAFISTTIIPLIIMVVVNIAVLYKNLRKPVLKFLRGDLSNSKKKKTIKLSKKIGIFSRFKIRVILQNLPSFFLILIGALFANLILMFGLSLPNVLNNYTENLSEQMLSKYQYMLTMPMEAGYDNELLEMLGMMEFLEAVETENETAEKFSAYTLKTIEGLAPMVEDVAFYGIEKGSKYVEIDHNTHKIYISSAYAQKCDLKEGDEITLKEEFENKTYSFTIDGIYDYVAGMAVFMDIDDLNEMFDLTEGTFVGYFSDTPITDIDEKHIGTVIDFDSLNKVSSQLEVSMGSLMNMVDVFAIIIFVVVVYLLSKIIIEKNSHSISVTKILGYKPSEIGRLYISSISFAIIFCFVISIPFDYLALKVIFKNMMAQMISGWLPLDVDTYIFGEMIALGIGTYAIVAFAEYKKVNKIPMDIALKTVE